jgi:hypothetical protein
MRAGISLWLLLVGLWAKRQPQFYETHTRAMTLRGSASFASAPPAICFASLLTAPV